MLNVEKFKSEIAILLNENCTKDEQCECCECNEICKLFYSKVQIEKWLFEEYKQPIELTQFEYDLLDSYVLKGYKFESCGILPEMHKKGYFKNVDTSMKIKEILENCVVKDDGN